MRKLIYQSIFAASCVYLYSGYASAACIQNPSFNNIQVNIPNRTYIIQYDDSTVRNLETITLNFAPSGITTYLPGGNNGECGAAYLYGRYDSKWPPVNGIAASNISGIGITVSNSNLANGANFNMNHGPVGAGLMGFRFSSPYDPKWVVTFKKTGLVHAGGSLTSGLVARLTQGNPAPFNSTWYLSALNMPANGLQIKVLSCSLKSPVPTINLGDWYDTQFPSVGSTSTEVDIPITLTCMAGTNIKATVTATSGTVNAAQGQLALSGGADKATGVAIQIIDANKNHIPLNSKRTIKDNVAAGDYIFGWKARYIKTADKITPGPANGTATINIRYE
ncbi:TPA: fimbrial protein [Providencia rettgeri]